MCIRDRRTGALDKGAALVLAAGRGSPVATVTMALSAVLVVSAVLNNIPVVVIFIPIMQAISLSIGRRPSRLLIPLSFAAMLGGMTTLIGSSTNLLVSSALVQLGERPFGFFDFTIPGIVLASVGLVYLLAIAPRLLPALMIVRHIASQTSINLSLIHISSPRDRTRSRMPSSA